MKAFYQALSIGARASTGCAIARAFLVRRDSIYAEFPTPPQPENDVALQWQDFPFAK